ncbi:MAG: DNA recombination protein RmuC [Bacilli bacterium]|jgi:DNA recombination protein RmuC
MTDELLIVAIVLLAVLLISIAALLAVLFKKRNSVGGGGGVSSEEVRKLLEDYRVNTLKDFNESVTKQNAAIDALKQAITNGMFNAQKSNQQDLYKYLDETKTKLNELQANFNKESSEVKEQNLGNIKNLIAQTTRDVSELKAKILAEINEVNTKNNQNVNDQNLATQKRISDQIQTLKDQVAKSLEQGFEKNDKAIQEFIARTVAISESARQIEDLRKEIAKFNNILSNQKTRGNFGEDVLENIFLAVFGENAAGKFYREQVNLSKEFGVKQTKDEEGEKGDVIVDFVYDLVTDHGVLPLSIDAKFPYSNYLPLLDENLTPEAREEARKRFKIDVKLRIKEVSKYIIDGKTAPYAVMFVPAEAVFLDIFKEFPDVVEEARKQRIIIASPSLIITIIQILKFVLEDYQRRNEAEERLAMIVELENQFRLFSSRWETHRLRVLALTEDVKKIDTTSQKIIRDFDVAKNLLEESQPKKIANGEQVIEVNLPPDDDDQ